MSFTFRPAKRENTPLIVGIAGPTKSGKTFSALRLATGIANGGQIAMINTEGPRGHQYADRFDYLACDLESPFRADRYVDALDEAAKLKPAVVIVDSVSHMHDGPGGTLEWHEEILDKIAGSDHKKRERSTFTAWVTPKAAENRFIYKLLSMECAVILAMRAKEKIRIVRGKPPEDLGWQPIVGERVAFETIFTLTLPPHSKGVPDLSISEMREPFDAMIPPNAPLDEETGQRLAEWSRGGTPGAAGKAAGSRPSPAAPAEDPMTAEQLEEVKRLVSEVDSVHGKDAAKNLLPEALPGRTSVRGLSRKEAVIYLEALRQKMEETA